jgi:hypothetical protein
MNSGLEPVEVLEVLGQQLQMLPEQQPLHRQLQILMLEMAVVVVPVALVPQLVVPLVRV